MRTAALATLLALSTNAFGAGAETTLDYTDGMTPPLMISGPSPEYTEQAIEHGIEGTVSVRCVVTTQGQVRDCEVKKSLPFMDRAVIKALEARKYHPALLQGKPVNVFYTFSIRLRLPDQ
jgi:protein TonB